MDDKTPATPATIAKPSADAPVAAPTPVAKRTVAEIADAIDARARVLLGGRARSIEALTAELRAAT